MFKKTALIPLVVPLCFGAVPGCAAHSEQRDTMYPAAAAADEQALIDAATTTVRSMRESGRFPAFDHVESEARGVLIFPNTTKAALVFGGEGGKGVLLTRNYAGVWSAPAFYGIGAGSVGFQVGYQRASIVLFLMNEGTVVSAVDRGLKLGADATIAAGTIGDSGRAVTANTATDVVEFVDAGGLFAGVSVNGAIIGPREASNRRYYGPRATTHGIVMDRSFEHPATYDLRRALADIK